MNICPLYYRDTHESAQSYQTLLLMVHGNLISGLYWNRLIEEIQRRDQSKNIRCVSIDLRGLGNSQQLSGINSIRDLSNDIYNFIVQTLKLTVDQIVNQLVVVGWSLGGAVTLQLAVDYPDLFRRLILVASAGAHGHQLMQEDDDGNLLSLKCITKEELIQHSKITTNLKQLENKNYNHYDHLFKKALMNSGRYPPAIDMLDYLTETFKQTNYIDIGWALNQFDISDKIHTIRGPVLLYHGALDKIVPIQDAYTNVHRIGKEKCKLVVHQDVSHMPPLEVPDLLAQEILNFLQ